MLQQIVWLSDSLVLWDWVVLLFLTAMPPTWFHLPSPSCSECSGGLWRWYHKLYVTNKLPAHLNRHQLWTEHDDTTVRYKRATWSSHTVQNSITGSLCDEPSLLITRASPGSAASCSVWTRPEASQMSDRDADVPSTLRFCESHTNWFNLFNPETPQPRRLLRDQQKWDITRGHWQIWLLFWGFARSGKMLPVFTLEVFAVQPAEYTGWWQEDKPTSIITPRWQPHSLRDIQFYFCGGGDVYESLFLEIQTSSSKP